MQVLRNESWREREPEPDPPRKRSAPAVIWEGDLGGHRYRRISRAGETVYQRRVAGEMPGDWRWKDWPRDPVLRLIENAYTGLAE